MDSREISKWMGRIQKCEAAQDAKKQERLQAIKLFTTEFLGKPTNNNTELSEVNFVYEYVKIKLAAVYSRDPYIFVRTNSTQRYRFVETMERVINIFWKRLRVKNKYKQALLDGILQPPGWIELGYMLISEKNKIKKDIEAEFPELKSIEKDEYKTEAQQGILDEKIKEDDVFCRHRSTWEILWPDTVHDIRNNPYHVIREKITLEDLLMDPRYGKAKYRLPGVQAGYRQSQQNRVYKMDTQVPLINMNSYEADHEATIITLYHIWDRRSLKVFTIAKNFTEETLYENDWPYAIKTFPFFPLILNEVPATDDKANSYPISDITPMLPQLKELSYISSAMNRHRKRAGTLLIVKKGALSDTQKTNIMRASDVDMVELDNIDENNLKGFTPPAIPSDFYQLRNIILDDLSRISGYSQLINSAKGVETATESENIRAGALLRQNEQIDIVEDHIIDVATYLASLLWQFKNRKQIEELIGEPVDEEMWPDFPEDEGEAKKIIENDLYFNIEAGSTQPPKDQAIERKQWTDVVGMIKVNFPGRLKDDVIVPQLLKKYDFKDIDSAVIKYDDEETAVAQKENELLMQGIQQVVGPNENHNLHLQVHAQAYQTPGMQPTPELDEHISQHAEFQERLNPGAFPQKGDSKSAVKTGSPDQKRQGVTDYADILGAVQGMAGTGANTGGPQV